MDGINELSLIAHVMSLIHQYGWAVQGVIAVEPGDVPFAYTVGLSANDRPEILVRGLPRQRSQPILNTAAGRMLAEPFEVGRLYDEILAEGVPVRFVVSDLEDLTMARQLYDDVSAVQLLWPDKMGHFPDEPGCDPATVRVQLGG